MSLVASAPRVVIRADGSHRIGLGHVYRMRALAQSLAGLGATVKFATLADTEGQALLAATGFEVAAFASPAGSLIPPELLDAFRPDVVVLDILDTDAELLAALRQATPARVIAFDDTAAGLRLADVVINALVFSWGRHDPAACRARLYEGPNYLILQDRARELAAQPHPQPERAESLVLSFGGSDDHQVTGRVLAALSQVGRRLAIQVNLGPGARPDPLLEEAVAASSHAVAIRRAAPSLLDLFRQADLVVCGGGVTVFELAALGTPSAAVATEAHEVANLEFARREGFAHFLGWAGDMDFDAAGAEIGRLLDDPAARRRMARQGPATVDGEGLARCAAIVAAMAAGTGRGL